MVIALQVHVLYFNNYINCEIRLLVHVYPGECELGTQSFTYTRKSLLKKIHFTALQTHVHYTPETMHPIRK